MASLYNIRSVVICLLAFAAFLRFDELAKLVRSDVKIENDMLKLFIQSSKTDQYRDGAWIVVASSRKATCPVAMMNRYLERAGLSCDSPLLRQLSKNKCGYKPRSKGLSYSRLRELVLEAFKDIVRFLIYSSFYLVGLARGTVIYGVQLAWGIPPRCKSTYEEVFHPTVVPRPHFS